MTNKVARSIFYLLKAIFLGLLLAGLLLFAFPELKRGNLLDMSKPLLPLGEPTQLSFADAVRRAGPAVVNIYTRSFSQTNVGQEAELRPQSLGSGVLMNQQGYLMTNYHVVAKADQIIAALQDGRFYTAELIGSDPYTDLAVLKIDGTSLPVIPQNDEIAPRVGDVVLAIGNPYNLGQTITQGIVSATGRIGMSSTGRQDFLQTDAAINEGNSGGALVNSLGEMVGINTSSFHLGQSAGNHGISFAIPYRLANRIMQKLIADGRVIRGYLGIDGLPINPVMAKLWNLGDIQGLVIDGVDPMGPAAVAGIRKGDLLTQIDGVPIQGVNDAMDTVAEMAPGTKTEMTLIRSGNIMTVEVEIGELKPLE